jgi:hypothetical protein
VFDGAGYTAYLNAVSGGTFIEATTATGCSAEAAGVTIGGEAWPATVNVFSEGDAINGPLPVSIPTVRVQGYRCNRGSVGFDGGNWTNGGSGLFVRLDASKRRGDPGWYGKFEGVPFPFLEGGHWTPFSIGRVPTIEIDDMSDNHPVGYRWDGGILS